MMFSFNLFFFFNFVAKYKVIYFNNNNKQTYKSINLIKNIIEKFLC